jgi:hypothetical protein
MTYYAYISKNVGIFLIPTLISWNVNIVHERNVYISRKLGVIFLICHPRQLLHLAVQNGRHA